MFICMYVCVHMAIKYNRQDTNRVSQHKQKKMCALSAILAFGERGEFRHNYMQLAGFSKDHHITTANLRGLLILYIFASSSSFTTL